ncbi:FAD-binding protein [Deltaproteobacteria bacterium]|nr:FAD-binding protein [Deltaproteobacteria bacterium]
MTTKVMDCDLVVLGAGGSGLVAAVKAFDITGKKVIVLEKSKKPGGAAYFASVMGEAGPIRDSKWQKDGGYAVSETQDVSGQWFDWLVSKGGAESYFKVATQEETSKISGFSYPDGRMGGGGISYPDRMEKYKDMPDHSIGPGRLGSWVVDKLVDCCQKQGLQLLTETRARKFFTDDRGRVSGVIADTKDGQLLVNCKACVIAAGGYGANKDLLQKYYPKQFNNKKIHSLCPPALTGDCIIAAEEIGAYIDPTIRSLSFPGGFFTDGLQRHPWSTSLGSLTGNGMTVCINTDGKRWKNEAGMGGGEISAQRDGVACAIFDSEILEAAGSRQGGMGGRGGMAVNVGSMMKDLDYEISIDEEGASGNHAKKADNLVELALKMKIDPRSLVDTIERYNKFCETGKDLDFGKPAQMLKAIKKPPFYAIFGHRWSQSTKGRNGIAVNSKFQALDTKGEVIPGLYAAGDGCTIFGGVTLNTPNVGGNRMTAEETAARAALSKAVTQAFAAAPSAGGPGGQGGMPMMGGGAQNTDILKGESAACGGLGPAFLSGYCAGTYAAAYIKGL